MTIDTAKSGIGSDDGFELLPPKGNENVGYRVFEILDAILKSKDALKLPEKWKRNYDLGRNKHWRGERRGVTLLSANFIHVHRLRVMNTISANSPTFNVRGADAGGSSEQDPRLEMLLRTSEYWWNEEEQQQVLMESVFNGETYGVAIEKMTFDPMREAGLGEVETVVVDPFHFGMFPVDCRDVQKAQAVLHFYPMDIREARRRWPDAAPYIKTDADIMHQLNDTRTELHTQIGRGRSLTTTIGGVVKKLGEYFGGSEADDSDQVIVVEAWVKDYTLDKNGNPLHDGFIRCVTTCSGGSVVMDDKSNPSINHNLPVEQRAQTYLYDKFPFSFTMSTVDTTTPWCGGDIDQLKELQQEIDKTLSQIATLKDRSSRVKIINPRTSGVDNADFTSVPGVINPSNSMEAQAIRYMAGPDFPKDLVQYLDMFKGLFTAIAGSFDMRDYEPGSHPLAYQTIAALFEHAALMMKGKVLGYSKMIRQRGRMFVSLMQNWYTEDRYISTSSPDGEEVSFMINGPASIMPVKLTVVSGSTMPKSQVQQREEAIALFTQGAIDAEELLKRLDWPNWREVVRRMQAGPIANFLMRLTKMGVPDTFIQAFQEIGGMEDQAFIKALNDGSLPDLGGVFNAAMESMGMEGAGGAEQALQQLEMDKMRAEIEKMRVDVSVAQDKLKTENEKRLVMSYRRETDKRRVDLENYKATTQEALDRQKMALETEKMHLEAEKMKIDAELREKEAKAMKEKPAAEKKE